MKKCNSKGVIIGVGLFIAGFFSGLIAGFIATCKDEDDYDDYDYDDLTEFDTASDSDDED